jgi:hypothetical protein
MPVLGAVSGPLGAISGPIFLDLRAGEWPSRSVDKGHSLDSPPVCEYAAWQLAKHLGEP